MSSNLVPTPIVNKNGVQTTVYRRVEQKAASRMIPAPAPDADRFLEENFTLISEMTFLATKAEKTILRSNLRRYRRDFQQELHGMLTQEDEVMATAIAAHVLNNDRETFIRECASFLPELDVDDLEYGATLVSSLHEHHQLPSASDYSGVDGRMRSQCLALMSTVAAVETFSTGNPELDYRTRHGVLTPTLTDDALAKAVIDDPEAAPEIIKVIREYRMGNYAAVRAVLHGANSSMALGAL